MNNPKRKINLIYLDKWSIMNCEYSMNGNRLVRNDIVSEADAVTPIFEGNFHTWKINHENLVRMLSLLDRKKLEGTDNYLILPSNFFYIFFFPLDKVFSEGNGDEYVRWRIRNSLPGELSSLIEFDFQLVKKDETLEEPLYTFLISAINKAFLKDISKIFFDMDIKLNGISNDCIEWLNLLDAAKTSGQTGLMVLDDSYTSLFFQSNGVVEYYRNFDIGTEQIKKNLASVTEDMADIDPVRFFEAAITVGEDEHIDLQKVKSALGDWVSKFQQSIESMRREFNLKDNCIDFLCVSRKFDGKGMLRFIENIYNLKCRMWYSQKIEDVFAPDPERPDVCDVFMLGELGEFNENKA